MIFIGIDVGLNGSIVGIDDNENIRFKHLMPIIKGNKTEYDVRELTKIFNEISVEPTQIKVVLEKEHVRPISGKRASFVLGFGYGLLQGLLEANSLSYEIVSPQEWMKELGISSKDEKGSIKYCQRKYPDESFKATERCTKVHDGLTDALSIAIFAKRRNNVTKHN